MESRRSSGYKVFDDGLLSHQQLQVNTTNRTTPRFRQRLQEVFLDYQLTTLWLPQNSPKTFSDQSKCQLELVVLSFVNKCKLLCSVFQISHILIFVNIQINSNYRK